MAGEPRGDPYTPLGLSRLNSHEVAADESERGLPLAARDNVLKMTSTEFNELLCDQPSLELEHDIFSTTLISHLQSDDLGVAAPAALTVFALVMQIFLSFTVMVHVETGLLPGLNAEVNLALFHMVYLNQSLSEALSDKLCGTYDISKIHEEVTRPDGQHMHDIMFFSKLPQWRWDTVWLGNPGDMSVLDQARFVTSEHYGFLPDLFERIGISNHSIHQGYSFLFIVVNFVWMSVSLGEFRNICRFGLMLQGVPSRSSNRYALGHNGDDSKLTVNHIPRSTKIVGGVVCVCRVLIGVVLMTSGLLLLRYTTDLLDLILNSLALVFILELDNILFISMLSKRHRDCVEELAPITYASPLPKGWRLNMHRGFSWVVTFCMILSALYQRYLQLCEFEVFMDNAVAICLFAGPMLDTTLLTPTPGICESLLKLTCDNGIVTAAPPNGPCVVTDYGVPWSKDVRIPSSNSAWPGEIFSGSREGGDIWTWGPSEHPGVRQKWQLADGDFGTFWNFGRMPPGKKTAHVMQKMCLAMYHPEAGMRNMSHPDWTVYWPLAPIYCPRETLKEYFGEFKYSYMVSPLTQRTVDVTGSKMRIHSMDPHLGKTLARCGR